MGLLFSDSVGTSGPSTPLSRLNCLIAAARSQKDIGRTLHEIKGLIAEHPHLRRYVTDEFKRPPCLVVSVTSRGR